MFKNYLKITFRNILRNKTYSFLNIFGLAIGIACAALILLWVEDELDYNHFISNRNNLYIVMKNKKNFDGNALVYHSTSSPLAQTIKTEIPGIKATSRTTWGNKMLFTLADKSIYVNGRYVDSAFLSMFSVPFIKGNRSEERR